MCKIVFQSYMAFRAVNGFKSSTNFIGPYISSWTTVYLKTNDRLFQPEYRIFSRHNFLFRTSHFMLNVTVKNSRKISLSRKSIEIGKNDIWTGFRKFVSTDVSDSVQAGQRYKPVFTNYFTNYLNCYSIPKWLFF